MKRSSIHLILILLAIVVMAGGFTSCGGTSKSSCNCAICINDAPAYPCDSEDSCSQFAVDQDCGIWHLTTEPSETCGGEAQPVCMVSDCSGQCQCPGLANPELNEEPL